MDLVSFESLQLLVDCELEEFKSRLRKLGSLEYPSDVPPDLISVLTSRLEKLGDQAALAARESSDDYESSIRRLRSTHRVAVSLVSYLGWIERSQSRQVPWSLLPAVEDYALALMPDRRILTACTDEFNYSITYRLAGVSDQLDKFAVLQLPALHRLDALMHVVIGHELFHPVIAGFFPTVEDESLPRIREACERIVKQRDPTLFDVARTDQVVAHVIKIWKRALEEIMCDLGCACIFGPAALFALSKMAGAFNLDEEPASDSFYPPWRYRLKNVMQYAVGDPRSQAGMAELLTLLKEPDLTNYGLALQREVDSLERIVSGGTLDWRSSPLIQTAYSEVEAVLGKAWEYIKITSARVNPKWTDCVGEISSHIRALEMLVPTGVHCAPGQVVGSPSSIPAIYFAGWIREIAGDRPAVETSRERVESYRRICRLVLKSVEDSYVRAGYRIEAPV